MGGERKLEERDVWRCVTAADTGSSARIVAECVRTGDSGECTTAIYPVTHYCFTYTTPILVIFC